MRGPSWLMTAVALTLQADAVEEIYNVTDFGAATDGQTLCTSALQMALDTAGATGGGTVRFPAGTFLSGALQLRSGVTLQFDAGATLLGSRDLKDYYGPPAPDATKSEPVFRNLLHGENIHDVTIRGAGTIDGNGFAFRDDKHRRPKNIVLEKCANVLVDGIHLRSSGSWMQDYKLCTNVVIRGISVFNHVTFNNDGLDIDSSENVVISDCRVDSDDDGICLKSTSSVPCRNVKISGCVSSSHCNGLKMGTESGGGFLNIEIANCTVFSPTNSKVIYGNQRGLAGIALEIVDGGKMENVRVSDVKISGVLAPIFIRLGDRGRTYGRPQRPGIGTLHNVLLKNISAENCSPLGCAISGLPGHPIENVRLQNISLAFDGGGDHTNTTRQVRERPDAYPECKMFGILPAYGFYCRHVKGLHFENVKLRTTAADMRHAMMFDDAETVTVSNLDVTGIPGAAALLRCVQTHDLRFSGVAVRAPADVLLQLEGDQTKSIVLEKSDLQAMKKISDVAPSVPADAFQQQP